MNALETQAAPTLASESTLAYSEEIETVDYPRRSWKTVTGIAAGIIALAGAASAVVITLGQPDPPAPVAVVDAPEGRDKTFIDHLESAHVPAQDWRYTVDRAKALCSSLTELAAPGGTHTVNIAREAVHLDHKGWSDAQVYNYVGATFETYCPQFWGPTKEQLAAMTPDERFVALIGDRTGLSSHDGTMAQAGHTICETLPHGYDAVVDSLVRGNAGSKGWDKDRAETFVDTAIEVHCPQ
ncbi:hypothetical protein PBI_GAIA_165 [Mycobacterium phage Gaia]|uniref:DUF732 domain-containing protein n=1 Tax=Mycobacterium phage Gaia TaxID=1486472 RepID=A0A068F4T1_9CAUD|nr:hypothetical protein VC46_gp071 [Mycobacterium phage Gaia]AID58981.1 hypothetical protein PBI_GAIA_165 [Mycobacterium phage Gaia]AYR00090.1 hypothetical protein PBI_NEBKISS_161 [Mycobacterium phage Nebkiss]